MLPGLSRNRGPLAKRGGHEAVGRGIGKDWAQISQIGEICDGALRPDERLTGNAGIEVAGSGDIFRTASAAQQRQGENQRSAAGQPEEGQADRGCHPSVHGHLGFGSFLLTGLPHRQGEVADTNARLPTEDGIGSKRRKMVG